MGLLEPVFAGLAKQLGRPSGRRGRAVALLLNRVNNGLMSAAVKAAEVQPGDVAADIGFGGGRGLRLLLDRVGPTGEVHGVELSSDMVDRAARRFRGSENVQVHQATMERLPFGDEAVDRAITVNTVYFVEDLRQAFGEVAGVLRPGGRFVIAMGDPEVMAKLPFTAHGFRLRPISEVIEALESRGLVVEHRRIGSGSRLAHLLVASPEA